MANTVRRSSTLNLSFPYDWSNPAISDEALIINVLNRGIFSDICHICAHFGLDVVRTVASRLQKSVSANKSLTRMFCNINKGFSRAQTR
jgi:hypothetical protein